MSPFQIMATLVTLTAVGGYLNHRFIKFPQTIGLMAFAVVLSLTMIFLDKIQVADLHSLSAFVSQIDFSSVLLHGMLSFLLFAGAMHINIDDLKNVKWSVTSLATGGVILATFLTGTLIWLLAGKFNIHLSYLHALLFGALISPTDPIAVLAILKEAGISKKIYTRIGGESLFNDGTGVVLFLTLLELLTGMTKLNFFDVSTLLAQEILGGIALGFVLGWVTYKILCSIDAYKIEILVTLALVMGGYSLAESLHISAPIFMVVAGLVVGNSGRNFGMSQKTREHLDMFWELVDDILNAILFILIGLEIIAVHFIGSYIILGIAAIFAVLAGRLISVGALITLLGLYLPIERGTTGLMTWGGLRGGLSIAMALSLPTDNEKSLILSITYIVVLFSILVQGLTFKSAVKFFVK